MRHLPRGGYFYTRLLGSAVGMLLIAGALLVGVSGATAGARDTYNAAVVYPSAPANSKPPGISGAAISGHTLDEAHGTWTNNPTGFLYQWVRCDTLGNNCKVISGATTHTYKLTAADVGHTIRVLEAAGNALGTGKPAISSATSVVQLAAPTVAQIKAVLLSSLTPSGKLAKIAAILSAGGFVVSFHAPEAGSVTVSWYLVPPGATLSRANARHKKPVLVASGRRSFPKAGTFKLTVKLTGAGKNLLKHSRHVKLTAKGSFKARGAAAVTSRKTFKLNH